MAKAPVPGVTPGANRKALHVKVRDTDYVIDFALFGPKHARMFRSATGMALKQVLGQESFDLDSLAALVWLTRVVQGEKFLKLETVEDEFPSYAEVRDGGIEVESVDDTDDVEDDGSPEA